MDDPQKPSSTQANIDELVKELSRPQNVPPASSTPNPTPAAPKPAMPNQAPVPPKPSAPPMPSSGMPIKPAPAAPMAPSAPAAPAPKPIAPSPAPTPAVPKEYQSSIRTMADDLSKLKSGQQPQGVTVPRTIEPPKPAPSGPTAPKPAMPNQAPVPKPSAPAQVNLGQTQKAAPMAPSAPAAPAAPKAPSAPNPQAKPAEPKNQFYTPEATPAANTGTGVNRNLVFGIIGVAAVVLGIVYWYFMIRQPTEVAVNTPIPTAVITITPTATPLDPLKVAFPNQAGAIVLPQSGDPTSAFNTALTTEVVNPEQLGVISISNTASGSANALGTLDLFNRFLINYPSQLQSVATNHSVALVYGQQESFDTKGNLVQAALSKRLVLVTEVASSSASILKTWEPSMTSGLAGLLSYNKAKNPGNFLDNTYEGVPVRYKNFPYPDHSIDYAVVPFDGKYYWVLASSRQSMFAAISALLNQNH